MEKDLWIEDAIRRSDFIKNIEYEISEMLAPYVGSTEAALEFMSQWQEMDIALVSNGYMRFIEALQQHTLVARELSSLLVYIDTELRLRYSTEVLLQIANGLITVENGLNVRHSELAKIITNGPQSEYKTATELFVIWMAIRSTKRSMMNLLLANNKK